MDGRVLYEKLRIARYEQKTGLTNFEEYLMSKAIVVSGSAGFIGGTFADMHRELFPDVKIYCIDPAHKLSVGRECIRDGSFEIIADVLEAGLRLLKGNVDVTEITHIFAFGAQSHVDFCNEMPWHAFSDNVSDVFQTLDFIRQWEHKPKFVYISTDEVGGQMQYHEHPWRPENEKVSALDMDAVNTRPMTHAPRNTYSATKAAAEMLVKGMCNQYGIPYCITRSVNNFGNDQGGGKFIPNIIDALTEGRPIPIRGTSVDDVNEHYRCWVAVEQHCLAVMETGYHGHNGQVRHVPGDKLRNIDVVKTISKQLDLPFTLATAPAREAHDIGYQLHDVTYSEVVTPGTIHTYFKK